MKSYLDKGWVIYTSISLDEKDNAEREWIAIEKGDYSQEELIFNIKEQLK